METTLVRRQLQRQLNRLEALESVVELLETLDIRRVRASCSPFGEIVIECNTIEDVTHNIRQLRPHTNTPFEIHSVWEGCDRQGLASWASRGLPIDIRLRFDPDNPPAQLTKRAQCGFQEVQTTRLVWTCRAT